ncbi:MAG: PQQ-dependent sugar dehydrogenase [Verrucomicrobiales bacterium]|nr:PQQ-dependent sugar dehydrogenase [Verrucomicrobiales bacterium]
MAHSQTGGLNSAQPIGKFLNGALPPEKPRPSTGSWRLVNAFPSLTFIDPVQMLPVPFSDRLMVVEKAGRLTVFQNDPAVTTKTVLIDIRSKVESSHDSGMLGMAFHPDFGRAGSPNRQYLYVYYRYTLNKSLSDPGYLRLSRFTWDGVSSTIAATSEEVLIQQYDRHNWHNGGGLFFGADGFLYVSVGDEGGANDQYNSGQRRDTGLLAGVLRIDVDKNATRSHPIRRQPRNPTTPPSGWPNSFSQGYYIPNDNPWQSTDGSQLEEFWAIGLRSPHRMTLDPATNDVWVGDIGQGTMEEVSLITKAANLQWPYREGTVAGPKSKPSPLLGTDQAPVHAYGRTTGTCVIGGYVYRGALHPDLTGKYIFGDHGTGDIWSLTRNTNGSVQVTPLVTLVRHGAGPKNGLSSFGIDATGEIYALSLAGTDLDGGRIYRLEKSTSGVPEPPKLLSQTTAFTDLASLTPSAGVMPYDVIQPLWSDGSDKKRWIALPNDGNPDTAAEKIGWSETGNWQFPLGTVLIKHFEVPGRRLETRFFVRGNDGAWFGFTYRWRPDGTEADLLPAAPLDETFTANGKTWTWHFPGRAECASCHTDAAGIVLGLKARHLNRDLLYPATGRTANQIVTLNRLGFFTPAVNEASLSSILTAARQDDTTASLEHRARSYLDINCSQCHQPASTVQTRFDARLVTPPWYQNFINVTPNIDIGVTGARIVKPGSVDLSVVHRRVGSLTTGLAMPPIAKNVVDTAGMQLLTDWINSLDPAIAPTGLVTGTPPVDHTPPRLTLALAGGSAVVNGPFSVTVTASEPIQGLTSADWTIDGGLVTGVTGSGVNWTVSVSPNRAGPGSLTLASDRITDLNGNANRALAAPLTWSLQIITDPATLIANGDFETGLTGWDRGGTVTLSTSARSGTQAVQLGAESFIVQSIPTTAGTNYLYTGWYRSQGAASSLQAGVSFYDATGRWIADRVVSLDPSAAYAPFTLEFTAPAGATSAAIWFLTGTGGGVLVDGLVYKAGGNGDPVDTGNLLANGNFESGLAQWDTGNQVTVSANAKAGTRAAALGALSFIVQNKAATPGESFALTGSYLSTGTPDRIEIGFSYWRADGTWITDSTAILAPSAAYADFRVETTVPSGAASMAVWAWCGTGGTVTVDELFLSRIQTSGPPNLLTNGGFETGSVSPWDVGGSATVVTQARTGNGALRLGAESFIVHNRAAAAGDIYRLSGYARADSGPTREAGFSFWNATGQWLGDIALPLGTATAYTAFTVDATVPAGAVSLSAWIWSGTGSVTTVDDLVLTREDPAAQSGTGGQATGGEENLRAVASSDGTIAQFSSLALSDDEDPALGGSGAGNATTFDPATAAGVFTGLIHRLDGGDAAGPTDLTGAVVSFVAAQNGAFTGRFVIDGRPLRFRGSLDSDGAHRHVYPTGHRIELQVIADATTAHLTGTWTEPGGRAHRITGSRADHSHLAPTDRAGIYTLLLPGDDEKAPVGYGVVGITAPGRVLTLGTLPDGRRFSHAGLLSADGRWSLFRALALRPTPIWLGGWLRFLDDDPSADLAGELRQSTGPGTPDRRLPVIGSAYTHVPGESLLVGLDPAGGEIVLRLFDPLRDTSSHWPGLWRDGKKTVVTSDSGPFRFAGSVNPRLGWLRGVAIDLRSGRRAAVEGVLFQKQGLLGGTHRSRDGEAGALIIEPGDW